MDSDQDEMWKASAGLDENCSLRQLGNFAEDVVEVQLDLAVVNHLFNWHQELLGQKSHQGL